MHGRQIVFQRFTILDAITLKAFKVTRYAVVWYDVLYRYSRQQHLIDRIYPSRTGNRYCYPIHMNAFDRLEANSELLKGTVL